MLGLTVPDKLLIKADEVNSGLLAAVRKSAFGTKRTYPGKLAMSAFGGKAELAP
jgi:hypothetical protein